MQDRTDARLEKGYPGRDRGSREGLRTPAWLTLGLFALLGVLLISAGCSTDSPGPGNPPGAPQVLVQYTRTGGIAGFDDRLVIFDNGQAVYSRRNLTGEFLLPAGELGELRRLLDDAGFPSLESTYPAPSPGADYFSYTITYGNRTVCTETGGVPDVLVAVIGRLDAILAEYAPMA